MKKFIAVLLSVVMLFSFAAVLASAEGEDAQTVTVTFYDEDGTTVLKTITVEKGTVPQGPGAPTKGDGQQWKFDGWIKADGSDSTKYYSDLLPVANEDTAYKATYVNLNPDNGEDDITIMSFLASIFERINKVFAQLASYFEELEASIRQLINNR